MHSRPQLNIVLEHCLVLLLLLTQLFPPLLYALLLLCSEVLDSQWAPSKFTKAFGWSQVRQSVVGAASGSLSNCMSFVS